MKTTQTFSILIWANKAKATNDGLPLFARITIDGKRAEISLKRKVNPAKWNPNKSCWEDTSEEARATNKYITHVKAELLKLYDQMQILDENITAESLKLRFTGVSEEKKTLLQIVDYHNEQMAKVVGINVVKITFARYQNLRRKLGEFIKHQYRKSDIYLNDLTYQFVTNFEYYLKSHRKNEHNTAIKDIKNLKKILNDAVQNDWLTKNPFMSFKCTFKLREREVLTIDEVRAIENKQFGIKRLQQVKDLFIFSCYTGLAYIDVMKLTKQHLSIGIDGGYWLFTERQKSHQRVKIPLLPQAFSILEKYKSHPDVINSNSLLPKYSNQRLNGYLKEVADICGIEKNLTFHLARHTFATTITLTNGVPIETVSKLLGHSSIKTTQIYAKVLERKVSEDMSALKSKLSKKSKSKVVNF
jgi:Site-specific recombinase XerD